MRSADEIRRDPDYRYIDGEYDLAGYFSDPVHGENARQRLTEVFADRDVIRDALEAAQRENERLRADAEVSDGVAQMVADDRDEALANLEVTETERDEARASAQRLIDLHDADMVRASKALADVCADRDAAVAREARLRAAVAEVAELYLYDGDADRPLNDGYNRLLALASVPPETTEEKP